MNITIDASEVFAFGRDLAAAPDILHDELSRTTDALLVTGVGFAQDYAPRDMGNLANSIHIIQGAGANGLGGVYGTNSLEYAWMREEGGTITGNPWLVFQVGGQWVKVRSVTQTGTHYMARSADALEPLMGTAYDAAIERVLKRLGGS